jgi:hypothetical protein
MARESIRLIFAQGINDVRTSTKVEVKGLDPVDQPEAEALLPGA